MKTKILLQTVALGTLLSGCANFSPRYQQPQTALADRWIGVSLKAQKDAIPVEKLGYNAFFLDPRLQKLITVALANNHDLRKAALNIQIAEEQYAVARVTKLPHLALNGGYTRSDNAEKIRNQYQVGLGISRFELDFFGRIKNQSQRILNRYLQTREAKDAAQLSIISAVAKAYYQWRTAEQLRDLAQKTLASRLKSDQLTRLRFEEGISSGMDVSTSQSSVDSARASYQQQLRALQQAKNALSTLVAQPLDDIALPPKQPLNKQFPQRELFVGIPSTILLNRPDIRQSEYGLKAANANIGVARAAMFPTISLTGSFGFASAALGDLFKNKSKTWSIGPSISLPIFDYGERKVNLAVAKIKQKIAIEDYQSTLQVAFQNVADALIARQTLSRQYNAQKSGQTATNQTLTSVRLQVNEGLANALDLLNAERNHFATRRGVLITQQQKLNNNVDLYTALGGGLKAEVRPHDNEKKSL